MARRWRYECEVVRVLDGKALVVRHVIVRRVQATRASVRRAVKRCLSHVVSVRVLSGERVEV